MQPISSACFIAVFWSPLILGLPRCTIGCDAKPARFGILKQRRTRVAAASIRTDTGISDPNWRGFPVPIPTPLGILKRKRRFGPSNPGSGKLTQFAPDWREFPVPKRTLPETVRRRTPARARGFIPTEPPFLKQRNSAADRFREATQFLASLQVTHYVAMGHFNASRSNPAAQSAEQWWRWRELKCLNVAKFPPVDVARNAFLNITNSVTKAAICFSRPTYKSSRKDLPRCFDVKTCQRWALILSVPSRFAGSESGRGRARLAASATCELV